MTEGTLHKEGVRYLGQIGNDMGWERKINFNGPAGEGGWKFPPMLVEWQDKPYTPIADLFFIIHGISAKLWTLDEGVYQPHFNMPLILEVNGMKSGQGHSSDNAVNYDRRRYELMQENYGIKTIPFKTTEVYGLEKRSVSDILTEIAYWLPRKEFRKL